MIVVQTCSCDRFAVMDLRVSIEFIRSCKLATTHLILTGKRSFARVCSNVCCEVIRTTETAVADIALEWFGSRVFACVSRKFVGT
eukprot:m.257687 g.257687  ORF g.257687 m.257687 type:complete len:85 (-) comp35580_c0_seq1:1127-1381(-)